MIENYHLQKNHQMIHLSVLSFPIKTNNCHQKDKNNNFKNNKNGTQILIRLNLTTKNISMFHQIQEDFNFHPHNHQTDNKENIIP